MTDAEQTELFLAPELPDTWRYVESDLRSRPRMTLERMREIYETVLQWTDSDIEVYYDKDDGTRLTITLGEIVSEMGRAWAAEGSLRLDRDHYARELAAIKHRLAGTPMDTPPRDTTVRPGSTVVYTAAFIRSLVGTGSYSEDGRSYAYWTTGDCSPLWLKRGRVAEDAGGPVVQVLWDGEQEYRPVHRAILCVPGSPEANCSEQTGLAGADWYAPGGWCYRGTHHAHEKYGERFPEQCGLCRMDGGAT